MKRSLCSGSLLVLALTIGLLGQEPASPKSEKTKPAAPKSVALKAPAKVPAVPSIAQANVKALRLAVEDLIATFGDRYPQGAAFLKRVDGLDRRVADLAAAIKRGDPDAKDQIPVLLTDFRSLQRDALLVNPLIDFDKLLLVNRDAAGNLGLPQNWQGNCALPRGGFDNEIAVLSPVRPDGKLTTLYRPEKGRFVGDVVLHFDAERMLFSMPDSKSRWQIWEIRGDGTGLRQVTQDGEPDVDNYDACYLPSEKIIFASTRCFQGVPCVGGSNTVANLCLMDADGKNIRQLCFDQDHNWCPTLLNDGRVLYSRWEYSDSPHYFTRLLFHMNPDGTGQAEQYGSNSPWPNSFFYARPIPNHPTKLVSVISGHHGVPRMGELLVFDPARGRHQADGALQRIPGHGVKVTPVIGDTIVDNSWPKFLHPYPLSDKYFLVSMKPDAASNWGIYLVDIFDNLVLLREEPGRVLFQPIPLRKTARPPVIPDRVDIKRQDATVYLADIYAGKGLEGVPRGTVKQLRIYEPHYAYPRMGGHIDIGVDGPWDVHRILGTVPVEADGSANFTVPANTPLTVQPLDEKGRSVQVMRSWFTAMPGEKVSCVGCHENQNTAPLLKPMLALNRSPSAIKPWYGPARGFNFAREVQPVLDKYCVGCHDGTPSPQPSPFGRGQGEGSPQPSLFGRGQGEGAADRPNFLADRKAGWHNFNASYLELHPYVRRPGPESDYFLQRPLEWHASTSELVQILEKGHHNVKLDAEAWDRLNTWIDLNVPDKGTWSEVHKIASNFHQRRLDMRTKYANRPEDPEKYPAKPPERVAYVAPPPENDVKSPPLSLPGWPFDGAEAQKRQKAAGLPVEMKLNLVDGVQMEFVLVPAGEFIMGDAAGHADEKPLSRVKIDRPFYMSKFEVTNAQYQVFDPSHDSAYISVFNKDQASRGQPVNKPRQPVVRVSWTQALEFCKRLSAKTGRGCGLPTEAQWEYACRAGTDTSMNYGPVATDFGKLANLADKRFVTLCRHDSPPWLPAITDVDDGSDVTTTVGRYAPNAWGLSDMHGNAAEWTRTVYRPYPYDAKDGRDDVATPGPRVVRGGSFADRPQRARSAFRQQYPPWQRVYNVGFRVIVEVPG